MITIRATRKTSKNVQPELERYQDIENKLVQVEQKKQLRNERRHGKRDEDQESQKAQIKKDKELQN